MSERPKRRIVIKSEIPMKLPRKWKNEEMETLLKCIMEYGHKDLEKIQKHLPGRSLDNIKTFMRTVHDTAGRMAKKDILDSWISYCDTLEGNGWKDCFQIAQVVKYLSVDSLLENHPLPERCKGINFGEAYRLVYQAMMGYPIQPVNKPTADFVIEALAELNGEIKKQTDAIKQVKSFLKLASNTEEPNPVLSKSKNSDKTNESISNKKPLKVYQRKKPAQSNTESVSSVQIIVEENLGGSSNSDCLKDYSVTVKENNSVHLTTINVPVPCKKAVDEDEQELLKSSSYNPFKIPNKWLEEPLYLNLVQKL